MKGKIIKGIAGFYYVNAQDQNIYECKAKGIFRNKDIKPLVGDDVEFSILSTDPPEGNIDEILERKNELSRPASANVDQVLVMFSLIDPKPNLNLLDRFLVMTEQMNIPAVIAFNKTDLSDEDSLLRYKRIYEPAGYPMLFISVTQNEGIDKVKEALKGKTTALAGPSGVGKSALTNLLSPDAGMEVGDISSKIRRGKNTTRHSELFCIGKDTYLMDTPGFSSMFVDEIKPEYLKEYFPEFKPYENECRFSGCLHYAEPDCSVKNAVTLGKISKSRYENYCQFYDELKEMEKRRY